MYIYIYVNVYLPDVHSIVYMHVHIYIYIHIYIYVYIYVVKSGETGTCQWEFQDTKMEVLYHIRPYFAGIVPYIGLI